MPFNCHVRAPAGRHAHRSACGNAARVRRPWRAEAAPPAGPAPVSCGCSPRGMRHTELQPLQSAAMTVCMRLRAPTIGRAGLDAAGAADAGGSSIQATRGAVSRPQDGSRAWRAEHRRQLVDQRSSPGGQRLSAVSPRASAPRRDGRHQSAAAALGLRQGAHRCARQGSPRRQPWPRSADLHAGFGACIRRDEEEAVSSAASAMPSDVPKRIFLGLRFATTTMWRPTSCAGS